jgi:hypothetical protein
MNVDDVERYLAVKAVEDINLPAETYTIEAPFEDVRVVSLLTEAGSATLALTLEGYHNFISELCAFYERGTEPA